MPKHFFITGLPRTRTAWLANFLTHQNAFCGHDFLRLGQSVENLQVVMKRPEYEHYEYLGDSDSGLILFAEALKKTYPNAPAVLVERPPEQVHSSLQKMKTFEKISTLPRVMDTMIRAKENFRKIFQPMVVQFEDLNQMETLKRIVQHLTPNVEFDENRWLLLDLLRVEIVEDKYVPQVKLQGDLKS